MTVDRKICPECGHDFKGNGWDGIDAHWKAEHESTMPYKEAWPLIKSGDYRHQSGLKKSPPVHFTEDQRKEYQRLMALASKKGIFK
jgi:hypothetical protein